MFQRGPDVSNHQRGPDVSRRQEVYDLRRSCYRKMEPKTGGRMLRRQEKGRRSRYRYTFYNVNDENRTRKGGLFH